MDKKLTKLITNLVSLVFAIMMYFIVVLMSKNTELANLPNSAMGLKTALFLAPVLIVIIFVLIPFFLGKPNSLVIMTLIGFIANAVYLGWVHDGLLVVNLHNGLAITGYVFLSLTLAAFIVDAVLRLVFAKKIEEKWYIYRNLIGLGGAILGFIFVLSGWVVALKPVHAAGFGVLASFALLFFIVIIGLVFLNIDFEYEAVVKKFVKEKPDYEEAKREALQNATHNTEKLAGGSSQAILNPELNAQREAFLKEMEEGTQKAEAKEEVKEETKEVKAAPKKAPVKKAPVKKTTAKKAPAKKAEEK